MKSFTCNQVMVLRFRHRLHARKLANAENNNFSRKLSPQRNRLFDDFVDFLFGFQNPGNNALVIRWSLLKQSMCVEYLEAWTTCMGAWPYCLGV